MFNRASSYPGQERAHAQQLHNIMGQSTFAQMQRENSSPEVATSVAKALTTLSAEDKALYKKYAARRVDTIF